MRHNPGFLQIVDEAKTRVMETDVHGVKHLIEQAEVFHLIDVREEGEWANGRLPGAVHLSKGIIERDIERRIPDRGDRIVLYCGGGYRSVLVADNLQRMGYSNVVSMDGGIRGWREAGYPLDKD